MITGSYLVDQGSLARYSTWLDVPTPNIELERPNYELFMSLTIRQ